MSGTLVLFGCELGMENESIIFAQSFDKKVLLPKDLLSWQSRQRKVMKEPCCFDVVH